MKLEVTLPEALSTSERLLQDVTQRVTTVCVELLRAPEIQFTDSTSLFVPDSWGIYLWRCLDSRTITYVGVATGKDGLRQRIVKNHLYPNYTKSVFRIAVSEKFGLDIREQSVDFIKKHFALSYLSCTSLSEATVKAAEQIIIAAFSPVYNKSKKAADNTW